MLQQGCLLPFLIEDVLQGEKGVFSHIEYIFELSHCERNAHLCVILELLEFLVKIRLWFLFFLSGQLGVLFEGLEASGADQRVVVALVCSIRRKWLDFLFDQGCV